MVTPAKALGLWQVAKVSPGKALALAWLSSLNPPSHPRGGPQDFCLRDEGTTAPGAGITRPDPDCKWRGQGSSPCRLPQSPLHGSLTSAISMAGAEGTKMGHVRPADTVVLHHGDLNFSKQGIARGKGLHSNTKISGIY